MKWFLINPRIFNTLTIMTSFTHMFKWRHWRGHRRKNVTWRTLLYLNSVYRVITYGHSVYMVTVTLMKQSSVRNKTITSTSELEYKFNYWLPRNHVESNFLLFAVFGILLLLSNRAVGIFFTIKIVDSIVHDVGSQYYWTY